MVDCVHELLCVWKQFTPDLLLQQGEEPKVWRVQVQTVSWVGYLRHSGLGKPLLHNKTAMCGHSVMKDTPPAPSPNLWASTPDGVAELLHDLEIQLTIHTLSLGYELVVDKSKAVKKTLPSSLWELLVHSQGQLQWAHL